MKGINDYILEKLVINKDSIATAASKGYNIGDKILVARIEFSHNYAYLIISTVLICKGFTKEGYLNAEVAEGKTLTYKVKFNSNDILELNDDSEWKYKIFLNAEQAKDFIGEIKKLMDFSGNINGYNSRLLDYFDEKDTKILNKEITVMNPETLAIKLSSIS